MTSPIHLILLPGLDGTGVTFAPLLKQLPSFIHPTVVTYPQNRPMGYEQLAPWVMAKLPKEPFILLGESFASPLAILIASGQPRGLRGLILCSAFARNPIWPAPGWLSHLCHPLIFRLYTPYVRYKWWRRGGGPLAEIRLAALTRHTSRVVAHRVQSVLQANVERQLTECAVPTLYIRGNRDRLISRRNMQEMAKLLPAMQTAELNGGHCVLRSRANLAAPPIVEFILNCDRRDAEDRPAA